MCFFLSLLLFNLYRSLIFLLEFLSLQTREAAPGSSELSAAVLLPSLRTTRRRSQRSRRIEAPPQQLPHRRDQMLCRIRRRRRAELRAEAHVPIHRLLHPDQSLRSAHLILHRLRAEAADPTALIPLTYLHNIFRCAFLSQPAAMALCKLKFYLRLRRR
eukprot:TRINITY_DN14052_c1_g2_i1.p1 TRINITY_DN14052_c1_g2~~TRINITY_DN14052_c1_g2_i1.p1  ORF type:complete len:159 (-),score=5.25 TRINITY_DN14052_c1_g2_i1:397-873(-)